MIKLSPFTLEVKLRYLSVILIIVSFCFAFLSIHVTIGLESLIEPYFPGTELNAIVIFTIYLVPTTLAWAMFNRWYFMIPTMIILGVVLLFTIVVGMVWDNTITSHPEECAGYFFSVIAETLIMISFAMYLKRTIKNRKVTSAKQ